MTDTQPALMTIKETSALTGFSEVTLYKWARINKIPSKRFGRSVRFSRRDIDAWLVKHERSKVVRKAAS